VADAGADGPLWVAGVAGVGGPEKQALDAFFTLHNARRFVRENGTPNS